MIISDSKRKELITYLEKIFDNVGIEVFSWNWIDCSHGSWGRLKNAEFYQEVIDEYPDVSFHHGASKVALEIEDFPEIVIKIPFMGDYKIHEDESEFDFTCLNSEWMNMFNCALGFCSKKWDYCKAEVITYDWIYRVYPSIIPFFAEIEFLMEYNGHPVYIQKKVEHIAEKDSDLIDYDEKLSKKLYSKISDKYYESFCDDDSMELFSKLLSCAYDRYDTMVIDTLIRFCNDNVNDLHMQNFGFDEDGIICIFDYSGYEG